MSLAAAGASIAGLVMSVLGIIVALWVATRASRNDARRARAELARERVRVDALTAFVFLQREHQTHHNLTVHMGDGNAIRMLTIPPEVIPDDSSNEPEAKFGL